MNAVVARIKALSFVEVIVIVAVLYFGWTKFQGWRDSRDDKKRTALEERVRVDTVTDKRDSVGLAEAGRALAQRDAEIAQLLQRPRTVYQPIPVGSSHDSVVNLSQQVKACRQESDTLIASVINFRSACSKFRDSTMKVIADKDIRYAHLDSLNKLGRKEKRVQSYGDVLYDVIDRRPVFRVGTTTKLLWSLSGKVEAEYSIPSAVKTNSGDGLRILAGGHIRF